jgi:hypothetical protein
MGWNWRLHARDDVRTTVRRVYTLGVSTDYPSNVIADDDDPVYYQQQVLETVSREALGL